MPWKASSVMDERLRFVASLLDGEAMTEVCRDFGVSRKTTRLIVVTWWTLLTCMIRRPERQ